MIISGQIEHPIIQRAQNFAELVWQRFTHELFSPFADLSIFTLGCALLIAVIWSARGRRRKVKVLWRAMFPRRWLSGPSARADWGFALFNRFAAGAMVGWAIVSGAAIGAGLQGWLNGHFGPVAYSPLPHWLSVTIATVALFLAYEFAYFIDHYLSHRIELLWHFHRVHHLAETLSPLTNNRVHPVDSIVFYNFIGVFTGTTLGLVSYALPGAQALELGGTNAIMIVALYLITHLQHSHIWLPLTGRAGRVVMSPAHHQLHHSDDPAHYNCNFGSSLALFDWLAGSLVLPSAKRQKLKFGAGTYPVNPHSVHGGLVQPFAEAFRSLRHMVQRGKAAPGSDQVADRTVRLHPSSS